MLYRKPVVHVIAILAGLYLPYYIWWRLTATMNPSAIVLSSILLIAEIQGILNYYLFAMMTWNTDSRPVQEAEDGLSVDVFIPTYNEEIEILEATAIGCVEMRYPHNTYLLDDGRRDEVRQLAERLGCGYLTRQDNLHAKAGNINAALKRTSGEFIAVFDADMVPQPDFLEKTLGYFLDPKTAIVQLPQEFYNLDSIQHQKSSLRWHEQQLFYRVIQPGKNNIDAPFWCGSPSVFRRCSMESIGGAATDSITEDFLTSIRLNAKGWKIRFHNEALAFGIAPHSLYAFNLQRMRWAQGAMRIFKSKDNPLLIPGLTLRQRFSHFSAIFTYFDAYQKLMYLLVPSLYFLTGIQPIRINNPYSFLIHWSVYFIFIMLSNHVLGRGYFRYYDVEKYNVLKMFTFIKASFSLFTKKPLKFRVTPKSTDQSATSIDRRELAEHVVLLIIMVFAVIFGCMNAIWHPFITYGTPSIFFIALFWAVFNVFLLCSALFDVYKRRYHRNAYRFPIRLESKIYDSTGAEYHAVSADLSSTGISLILPFCGSFSQFEKAVLYIPQGEITFTGSVTYQGDCAEGKKRIGIRFHDLPCSECRKLLSFLYITMPRQMYDKKIDQSI